MPAKFRHIMPFQHNYVLPQGGGGVLRISSDGDDRRIFFG